MDRCSVHSWKTSGGDLLVDWLLSWKDGVKMDFKVTGCGDVNWIELTLNAVQWWALMVIRGVP
jgi:hypothetical protein